VEALSLAGRADCVDVLNDLPSDETPVLGTAAEKSHARLAAAALPPETSNSAGAGNQKAPPAMGLQLDPNLAVTVSFTGDTATIADLLQCINEVSRVPLRIDDSVDPTAVPFASLRWQNV